MLIIGGLTNKNPVKQLKYLAELCEKQNDEERYFVHAHPDNEVTVELDVMADLRRREGVEHVPAEQCRVPWKCFSRSTTGWKGTTLRAAGWLSNSQCIARNLRNPTSEEVDGPGGERLQNNAQRAPANDTWTGPKLCDELQALILRGGLREQLADRGWLNNFTVGASCEEEPVTWTAEDYEGIRDNGTGLTMILQGSWRRGMKS